MEGGAPGDGAFPVSFNLAWHGGLHIVAPVESGQSVPVRSIADGTVLYLRPASLQPSGPLPPDHPLGYRGGWTDDGVVVVQHDTEIGEGATAAVRFFSVYMHLKTIHPSIVVGREIKRKAVIGGAGQIYGETARKIHFEILSDDANMSRLIGRGSGQLSTAADGRSDSVFGEVYVLLPRDTPIYATKPPLHISSPSSPAAAMTSEELIVGIQYSGGENAGRAATLIGGSGNAYVTTYRPDGSIIGLPLVETSAEYRLYRSAIAIRDAHRPAAATSPGTPIPSASAIYELLRFGRVLGTDQLVPADAPNWWRIRYPGGEGWVDLNRHSSGSHPATRKFSDADFPHWKNWAIVDDSEDQDSRCSSATIRAMLDIDVDGKIWPAEAVTRLTDPRVAGKLRKAICKFPNEWDASTFDTRWGWLRYVSEENMQPLSSAAYERFKAHVAALSFVADIPAAPWHWEPREFIKSLRKCKWLSTQELAYALAPAPREGIRRAEALRIPMNKMLRKYLVSGSRLRITHFLAQVGHETGWWQHRQEIGNDRYFRTMYETITPHEAAQDYRSGLARRLGLVRAGETEQAYSARRPGAVAVKARQLHNGAANSDLTGQIGDGPRFRGRGFLQITGRINYKSYSDYRGQDFTADPNPALLATNDSNACDASGFYWAREGANAEADVGAADRVITRVGGLVNRGRADRVPLHDNERRVTFRKIWRVLNDET